MDSLPMELIEYILNYIPELRNLYNCLLVNYQFNRIIRHKQLYQFARMIISNRVLARGILDNASRKTNTSLSAECANINKKLTNVLIYASYLDNIWIKANCDNYEFQACEYIISGIIMWKGSGSNMISTKSLARIIYKCTDYRGYEFVKIINNFIKSIMRFNSIAYKIFEFSN